MRNRRGQRSRRGHPGHGARLNCGVTSSQCLQSAKNKHESNTAPALSPQVDDAQSTVSVEFTPTIPHCSMATLIGLSIKVKLLRSLPERFKLDVHITPGTHASEHAVNKQLADKERVAAALENSHLLEVVNQCLSARS
ncbi:cytosolic iron-sulfur assembly component 2B [Geospiza fortis]|uniref:Cytosolic iron-sulfur assembly component 2B n=1 Tax=Geospiza fortis TaxID=48883 RepID=A0A6I9HRU3_GEOFO|nr:cytosolic iron-sulfur assembly component 2B [Geospiza fortis]